MNHEWAARGKYRVQLPDLDYYRRTIKCQAGCPVGTNAREYVIAIAQGDYERAYLIARQCNPFASVCGRVCQALCEVECRRGDFDAAIAIRALKRFVNEQYGVEAGRYSAAVTASLLEQEAGDSTTVHDLRALGRLLARQADQFNDRRQGQVAVIGAGPAGLAAAHDLALMGHRATVFEASDVAGGMLRLGIPAYRLPYDLLEAEIQIILDLGVELRLNTPLGPNLTLTDLRKQGYEAIFIAVGMHRSRELNIDGMELDGVLHATDFLLNVNRGYQVDLGNRLVVVGGGNVAMDAARTALRQADAAVKLEEVQLALDAARSALRQVVEGDQEAEDAVTAMDAARLAMRMGATEVNILYRRSRAEMPANDEEVAEAEHEGVRFRYLTNPVRILGNPHVTAVECIRMELGPPDESGRRRPLSLPGSEFVIEADSVIMAIGLTPDLSFLREEDGIQLTRQGNIIVDPETMATTAPGVFSGGDVAAAGPRIIIQAVADGLRAARAIDDYLQGQQTRVRARGTMTVIEPYVMPPNYQKIPRRLPPTLPLERRVGIAEVELVYPEAQAHEQANRCLRCHVQTVFDGDKCILCGGCVDVCPERCLKMVELERLEETPELADLVLARFGRPLAGFSHNLGTAMIKDDMRCIRCGLCAKRCPTGAITMEALSFVEEYVDARSEIAPSKPEFRPDRAEAPKSNIEKIIALALVLTLVIGGFFLFSLLKEPTRMAATGEEFRLRAVAQGEELFAENCAMCHGAKGQGVPQIGSVLYSKDFLTAMDDAALHEVIRDGRPNTAMPAFGEEHGGSLSAHQINELTAFIRNWESTAPVLPPVPQAARSERAAAGAELYNDTCAICHGENGQGGIGRTLNSEEFLTAFDDAYLKEAIASGRPRLGMPTWGKVLSPSQIEDLVIFIRDWEEGSSLYARYCSFCHGVLGQGGPNPSNPNEMVPALNSVQYLDTHDDSHIRQTISEGVEGTGMLAAPLSEIEVDKIVEFLREWREALAELSGAEMFTRYCATCHGSNGEGGANPFNPRESVTTLNSQDYLSQSSDEDIYRSIVEGVSGTGMMALSQQKGGPLTGEEISELVAFIRGWETGIGMSSGAQAQPTPAPEATPTVVPPTAEGDAARGAELFAANCAPCHGPEGQGGAVVEEPLNSAELLDSRSDDDLRQTISDGVVGTAMPPFGGTLTAQEIADIIAFFRSW